jgi:parvulin-like peptidyl-prolyl isomerase
MRLILSLLKNNYREFIAIWLLLLIGSSAWADRIEGIVAVVDDTIVMVSDLRERLEELGAPKNNRKAERQVLELMVEDIVVEKIYKSIGFPPVSDEEAQQYAQSAGIREKDASLLIMKSTLMELMVKSRVVITENMIKNYYDDNEEYTGRESIRLKQILIKDDEQKTLKALEEIQKGKDFDEVAREFSDILLSDSADIGWVAIEDLSDDIKNAVVSASTGEVVGPLNMNDYAAIFEIMDKALVGTKNLSDVRPEIVKTLEAKYQQEAFQHWLQKMMSEYFIGIYI